MINKRSENGIDISFFTCNILYRIMRSVVRLIFFDLVWVRTSTIVSFPWESLLFGQCFLQFLLKFNVQL